MNNPAVQDRAVSDGTKTGAESPSDTVSRLAFLSNLNSGFGNYYCRLLRMEDPSLAVAAACALTDSGYVPPDIISRLMQLARYKAVKTKAFDFFMRVFEYDLARQVAEVEEIGDGDITRLAMLASIEDDHLALSQAEVIRFLQTGNVEHFSRAVSAAESAGWQAALPLIVKLVIMNPQDGQWSVRLWRMLAEANQRELVIQMSDIVDTIGVFPTGSKMYRAFMLGKGGKLDEALKLLDGLDTKGMPKHVELEYWRIRADVYDRRGDYAEADRCYQRMNVLYRTEDFSNTAFIETVKKFSLLQVPDLPDDSQTNHFVMTGFPRTGTTLLLNVLNSHPEIETMEEIPSWQSGQMTARKFADEAQPLPYDAAMKVRARYYREIDRRRKKPDASIIVDKLPILSAEAVVLERFFPKKKYVFTVRHPYDVVLSCYRYTFNPNPAMDNFTTMEDAFRAYDFVMGQWFKVHGLQSERVCYTYLEKLVTDPQKEITRVLEFLGTNWHPDTLQFAKTASERKARTWSYAKVRSGFSIGVQTAWRNYEFLFRKPEAKVLDKWLDLFGYEGL